MDLIKIKISAKRLKKLSKASIEAECERRHKPPEVILHEHLLAQPAVAWATYDWDDVRPTSQKAMAILLASHTYLETYKIMLRILMLYEALLSNCLTPVEPLKRLAIFINETATVILEDAGVRTALLAAQQWPRQDEPYLRGKVVALITTPSCRRMLLNASERFFFAELNCCGELPAQSGKQS